MLLGRVEYVEVIEEELVDFLVLEERVGRVDIRIDSILDRPVRYHGAHRPLLAARPHISRRAVELIEKELGLGDLLAGERVVEDDEVGAPPRRLVGLHVDPAAVEPAELVLKVIDAVDGKVDEDGAHDSQPVRLVRRRRQVVVRVVRLVLLPVPDLLRADFLVVVAAVEHERVLDEVVVAVLLRHRLVVVLFLNL